MRRLVALRALFVEDASRARVVEVSSRACVQRCVASRACDDLTLRVRATMCRFACVRRLDASRACDDGLL